MGRPPEWGAGRDAPTGARRKRFRRNLPRRFRAGLSLSRKGPRRPRLCASADPDLRRRSSGTARSMLPNRSWEMRVSVDAQADMLSAEASSAMCVQKFDDSRTVCRSHYVSHLAAFFIVARAKISVVESYQCGSASAKSVSSRAAYSASVCVVCLECVGVCEGGRGKRERWISLSPPLAPPKTTRIHGSESILAMILPQVHLRKPCYDFSFL